VDRARRQFLARTAFAADQDRGLARSDPRDQVEQLLRGRGVADDAARGFGLGPALRGGGLEREVDHPRDLLEVDRFGEVVEGAGAERSHRRVDLAVGGQDHDRGQGCSRGDALDDRHAVDRSHAQIRDDDVEALAIQTFQRRLPVVQADRLMPAGLQGRFEQENHLRLVVDEKNPRHVRPRFRQWEG
jgi:hypothetical protein